jgi:hypothetical protein
MRVPALRHRGVGGSQRNSEENELGDPAHTEIVAITLPYRILGAQKAEQHL